jgi:hypothetical protein
MARNVKHAGKVSGSDAIVATKPGATITKNDPAKFHGAGKTSGKTPSNGVVDEATGPTITCNRTHIPTPNADKPAKSSKVIASRSGSSFRVPNTSGDLTASQTGSGGPSNKPYGLKTRYDKDSHDKPGAKDPDSLPNL